MLLEPGWGAKFLCAAYHIYPVEAESTSIKTLLQALEYGYYTALVEYLKPKKLIAPMPWGSGQSVKRVSKDS